MKTINWKDFNRIEFPKQAWLIQNLIPREGLIIIASPSGEKKTWVAMHMAVCIANGKPFLGHGEFETEKGNVLYVDEEMSSSELQRRGRLLGLQETTDTIHLATKNDLNLSRDADIDELYSFVEKEKVRAVVIDTLRSVAGGLKEDKAEDVRAFFNRLRGFKDKGVAVIILDHCRKPTNFDGNKPKKEQLLGSQDKLASIEPLLMIKSEERSGDIGIYHKKSRGGVEYPPFRVEMKDVLGEEMKTVKIELKYGGKVEEKEYVVDMAKDSILNFLSTAGKKRKEILSFLNTDQKIGSKNSSDAIRRLEADNRITVKKIGRENHYEINPNWSDDKDPDFADFIDTT